ncbi:hypothetical protein BHF69_05395 [Anaerostipes sp. 992a]|uniref:polysaccharide pyruvyl transferase family protein n=1 Tax=Anaerostipes sp. 992a TaxID=1261637 RepID=UPI000953619E|nr:polysaccharide pyruvyl transferase family protein [Anaerostipes sp. 992a]OLR62165.1 hypothetical protein BHF69_05395 [Anaerostipes sp. 992a]
MSKKYLMYPHGGSGNHGCEAIVRTTINLIGTENDFTLFSDGIEEDQRYIENRSFILKAPQKIAKRMSLGYFKAFLQYHINHRQDAYDALSFSPIIKECLQGNILLSIGGDNYCYGDNEHIYLVNRYAKRRGCKTVLWGCSVEPDDITPIMSNDLKNYDLIVARESLSFKALKKINEKTVLLPDPAFTLPVGNGIWPAGLKEKSYVGINISPLIQSREQKQGITFENYKFLVQKILEETEYNIALIPHVVKDKNDDRVVLQQLYKEIGNTERIFLVQDQNCLQLKDIISHCDCFVGARTHATIAAYSLCVPTLVVGYSVKARGIAMDLFGTEEHFVIPVQNLIEKTDLYLAYTWIMKHREEINQTLKSFMPKYIQRAFKLRTVLESEV